jgi:hypothetical protein
MKSFALNGRRGIRRAAPHGGDPGQAVNVELKTAYDLDKLRRRPTGIDFADGDVTRARRFGQGPFRK